jgi:DNA mismatch repair protein MutS2
LRLELPVAEAGRSEPDELNEGAEVRLALGGSGTLREIRGSQAQVEVSGKRLWVPLSELEATGRVSPPPKKRVHVEASDSAPREINLIGLDGERAREDLERFLDQAMNAGRAAVRVVHGHGLGVLRRMVADVCRTHPAVRAFHHPPQHLGGTGATEIDIDTGA